MKQTTPWQKAHRCTGCGHLSDGYLDHDFCPSCGNSVPHEMVAVKIERRFFGKDRVTVKLLEKPVRFRATPEFCAGLATLMEIEIDGGDDAASYVKDCIEEVYQRMGHQ